jgi:phytoene/squalene synthetase
MELIDARAFDLYDEPMGRVEDLEHYARRTSSALIELSARVLGDGRDPNIGVLAGHAGIAYAIAGLLRAFAFHAGRGQLYLPAEIMQRHGVDPLMFSRQGHHRAARGAGGAAAAGAAASWRCARSAGYGPARSHARVFADCSGKTGT